MPDILPTILFLLHHSCIPPECTCYYGKQADANRHHTATAIQPRWHHKVCQNQSQTAFRSKAGVKPKGYIIVHEAAQRRGPTQHPTSKVAWDLQGPSAVQQCQHNDKYITHNSLPSQEITTAPWQWSVAAKYVWPQPYQGQHVYDQLPLYAPSILRKSNQRNTSST